MALVPEPAVEPDIVPSPLRGAARENAILDAAIELVAEIGYERITVDAIAARARASKATMYRRWAGKAELVADALRRQAQGDIPAVPDMGSLRTDLLLTVDQIAETFVGRSSPSLIGLLEAVRDDGMLRELIGDQVRRRSHEVGRTICARAVERGERLHVARAESVLDIAFSQVFSDTLFGGRIPEPAARERLVDEILLPLLRKEC